MKPNEAIESLKLTVTSTFIPWSQSRKAGEKYPSLNWKITLLKAGKPILTTDYSAGCGHVPGYNFADNSIDHANMVKRVCETGKSRTILASGITFTGKPILPNPTNVIYSLVIDSDVLNHPSFEEWAEDFGYDTDSRQAEKTYQACLQIALTLCNTIGDAGFSMLQEAFQDY